MKKLLNTTALIVEFTVFTAFLVSSCLLYYAVTRQTPVRLEQPPDNDFVPLVLLILLAAGALVFGFVFFVHFAFWQSREAKNKIEFIKPLG